MGRVMRQHSARRNTLRYCALLLRRAVGADPAALRNIEDDPIRVLELALEVSFAFIAEVEEEFAAGLLDAVLRLRQIIDLEAEVVCAHEAAWIGHVGGLGARAGGEIEQREVDDAI